MLIVVAALIECEGRLLVCQRRRGERFELLWEFPGGKVEAGETLQEALARELREELGAAATIGPEVYRTRHEYAQMKEPIELIFFRAQVSPAAIKNLVFEQIQWREPRSLLELDFLLADRDLVEKIARGEIRIRAKAAR